MQPIEIQKFLGLRNTVSEERQPLGALTHADNILIDNSGTIIRRKGNVKIASGQISSSYGTRDNSGIYIVDGGSLYLFDGEKFTFLCDGMGDGVVLWCEESASLVFAQSEQRFVAVSNGTEIIDLDIPVVDNSTIEIKVGALPKMKIGLAAQYVSKKTGLRGALSTPQIVDVDDNSSLLITVPPITDYYVNLYGFFENSGAWSLIGEFDNIIVISDYPQTNEPADDAYFDVAGIPSDVVAMTFHLGKIAVATITENKTSLITFSSPSLYHLFDTINVIEIPDLITSIASTKGHLLITCMRSIFAFDGDNLQRIANYGTPVGRPICLLPDDSALIWTNRGVCKYPEFQNITENVFSVPAGFGCNTSMMEVEGNKFLTIATDDLGSAYNASFNV
jgi:hypothetical protein